MNSTRIAGPAFDARYQHQVETMAKIYSYARRIRNLATAAAESDMVIPAPKHLAAARRTVTPALRPRAPAATLR